jgi:isoamylase
VNRCGWDRWRRQNEGVRPHDSPRAVVLADEYDWCGDAPLRLSSEQMIIYELHVGGFTRHPSSGVRHPGTFAGLVEKIPYLKDLGITHVELMPVMAFDEQDVPEGVWEAGLRNYWGYSTHSFFSPHPGYCVTPERGSHRREFRDMVKALHRAGIGVILDVVFNHTCEGNGAARPCHSRGSATRPSTAWTSSTRASTWTSPAAATRSMPTTPSWPASSSTAWSTGCGRCTWTASASTWPAPWPGVVTVAHGEPPVLWGIELSDVLAATKIIAEAWDAAGLYQVGSFPGYRWMEWNGRYRDSLRRFVRGDPGLVPEVATRIAGSSDLYGANLRLPINSINFVTCHDGFTLWDLVSYDA